MKIKIKMVTESETIVMYFLLKVHNGLIQMGMATGIIGAIRPGIQPGHLLRQVHSLRRQTPQIIVLN